MRQNPYAEILKLARPFPSSSWPAIDCQICGIGRVQVIAGKTEFFESADSRKLRERDRDNWEAEWAEGLFQAQLLCSDPGCQTRYLAIGKYKLEQLKLRQPDEAEYQEILSLLVAQPSFPISDRLPSDTPDLVNDRIKEAAGIVWLDPNAAGNRLRLAVEELLTERGIPKTDPAGGPSDYLTTHARINLFKKLDPEAAKLLFAVKWVGNGGSHGNTLNSEKVVLQMQILHEALKTVYNATRQNILKQAAEINLNKGI